MTVPVGLSGELMVEEARLAEVRLDLRGGGEEVRLRARPGSSTARAPAR